MPRTIENRITLYDTSPFTFPANTPFFIKHGYHLLDPHDASNRQLGFKLFIDGVQQVGRKRRGKTQTTTGIDYWLYWRFIFPQGLPPGSYVFRREFWLPCYIARDDWKTVPSCADPNEIILGHSNEKTGTFSDPYIKLFRRAEYNVQID